VRTTIQINNEDFYFLACGERNSFKISADEEITISQTTSMIPDHIFLQPKKGRDYFFANDCNGWVCWFELMEKGAYRSIAETCGKEKEVR
jgi:hypothetical protein